MDMRLKRNTIYTSLDGSKQIKIVDGTIADQKKQLLDEGFSLVSAAQTRALIEQNRKNDFDEYFFRTGTGAIFASLNGPTLYLTPQNAIFLPQFFDNAYAELSINRNFVLPADYVLNVAHMATHQPIIGIRQVNLTQLDKDGKFIPTTPLWGEVRVSTKDYRAEMQDDPNIANLVTSGFGEGDDLGRIMHELSGQTNLVSVYLLSPSYVEKTAADGIGLARVTSINRHLSNGAFVTNHASVKKTDHYAFGIKHLQN